MDGNANLFFSVLKLGVGNNGTRIAIDDPARTITAFAVNGFKITGDTTLIHTGTALLNGAAANVGTLNNAPAAGNPTKWIRIDDNGTPRFIPAW